MRSRHTNQVKASALSPGDRALRHQPGPLAGLQPLPPSPKMLAEVAVETASSPGVRGKCGQRGGWIWTREVDAVVAEEDPIAVSSVGVAGEVRTSGRSDLCTPASAGIPCREALPDGGTEDADAQVLGQAHGGRRHRARAAISYHRANRTVPGRSPQDPGGFERGGDITAASPGVLGVIVSGQRGRSGVVFTAVVLSTRP
jgi:hypothetical protein